AIEKYGASPPATPTSPFFPGPKKDWTKKGPFRKKFCPTDALSKLAYRTPGYALQVTHYARPVTAPFPPNAQTVEIALILL
ncbi:MAG: hypothetical protein ACM31E_04100, partial [Fibrobacterota bacterium]